MLSKLKHPLSPLSQQTAENGHGPVRKRSRLFAPTALTSGSLPSLKDMIIAITSGNTSSRGNTFIDAIQAAHHQLPRYKSGIEYQVEDRPESTTSRLGLIPILMNSPPRQIDGVPSSKLALNTVVEDQSPYDHFSQIPVDNSWTMGHGLDLCGGIGCGLLKCAACWCLCGRKRGTMECGGVHPERESSEDEGNHPDDEASLDQIREEQARKKDCVDEEMNQAMEEPMILLGDARNCRDGGCLRQYCDSCWCQCRGEGSKNCYGWHYSRGNEIDKEEDEGEGDDEEEEDEEEESTDDEMMSEPRFRRERTGNCGGIGCGRQGCEKCWCQCKKPGSNGCDGDHFSSGGESESENEEGEEKGEDEDDEQENSPRSEEGRTFSMGSSG